MGFVTCGPNEAIIVTGCCHAQPLTLVGGRAFVWPCCQQCQRISLNTWTMVINTPNVETRRGVAISLSGIAQVKVNGNNREMLLTACKEFLGKSEHEIRNTAKEILEGHQRSVMGQMTVEEIYTNRKKFSMSVFEVASCDLVNLGLSVVSYTVKDFTDSGGYLKALGMARTAQMQREAEAQRDAGIREAFAEEQRVQV